MAVAEADLRRRGEVIHGGSRGPRAIAQASGRTSDAGDGQPGGECSVEGLYRMFNVDSVVVQAVMDGLLCKSQADEWLAEMHKRASSRTFRPPSPAPPSSPKHDGGGACFAGLLYTR